jgi:hypothetical protein
MFSRKLLFPAAICGVVFLSGCASIMNEADQKINVTTSGNKAITGNVNGVPFTAPGVVTVKREKAAKILNVDTAGCTKQTTLPNEVDSKFWINVLSGGPFGSSTDYGTEKMWKYQDNVAIACQ